MSKTNNLTENIDLEKDIEIKVYDNIDVLEEIKDQWNELLSKSIFPNIFLTWQWIANWWDFFGKDHQLNVIVVRSKSNIIAILPFQICTTSYFPGLKIRKAGLIGDGRIVSPDYLGPIIHAGYTQYLPDIIATTQSVLLENNIIQFSSINLEDPSIENIVSTLTKKYPYFIDINAVCPVSTLSDNYEKFFKNLSINNQKKLKRKMKKAEKELSIRFECLSSEDSVQDILGLINKIFRNSTRGQNGSFSFAMPQYFNFHSKIISSFSRSGWLRFFVLYYNDEPACYIYGYYYNRIFWFYQTSYDLQYSKFAPGLVAFQKAIKYLIDEGAEQFDFLRGDEPYKFFFADKYNRLSSVTFFKSKSFDYLFLRIIRYIRLIKHKINTWILKYKNNEKDDN